MIRVEKIKKTFNEITAVNNVTLTINEKEIHGLVGPDGAGKTTLMRIICGLTTQDFGKVLVMGENPENKSKQKNHFGYMPQRFSLYGDLTVIENINLFGQLYGFDNKTIKERSDEILQITNMHLFKNRFADNLSGGMKQKLSLTCTLVTRPKILILDEPTFGVDPESRKEIWKILYHLNQSGITILVSTPYMDEAELCTKISFINAGNIIAEDTPTSFKSNFQCTVYKMIADKADIKTLKEMFEKYIIDIYQYGNYYHFVVPHSNKVKVASIFDDLLARSIIMTPPQEIQPSMEDIFVYYSQKEVL